MFRYLFLLILVFGSSLLSTAQVDSLQIQKGNESSVLSNSELTVSQADSIDIYEDEELIISPIFKPKPMIGFGIGTFTFYGDTGSELRSNNPFNSSIALSFNAQMPVKSFLDLSFSAVFSTVTVNEPGLRTLNNFQSEITGGTALLTYNFENFLPKTAVWQPYVGTGISSFEFLSKADLFDSEGLEYNLWSDGSLMSLPENSPSSSEAIKLKRDYIYETDLRGLNREQNGAYPDRTLSIPLAVGLNFKFSKHLKGQLGTTLFFNMNDLADDVQDNESKSDGKNDKFLHSALSMSYDLHIPTKKKQHFDIEMEDEEELISYEYWDKDNDGIPDLDDDCLDHPEGIEVDKHGCPLDSDKDGVADYKDDEPTTEEGLLVDEFGVAIEDEIFLNKYMVWIDSLGADGYDELYSRVDGEKGEHFAVLVLPDKRGMNQREINSLLAEENVRATSENGEEGFLIGDFESLPEAVSKKLELEKQGLIGSVQKEVEGKMIDIDDEISAMSEIIEERNRILGSKNDLSEIHYRVQVGAFRYNLSENIFTGIDDLLVLGGDDGLTRYMTESYSDAESAANRRVQLLLEGFEDAFITAYNKGNRITLSNAGMGVVEEAKDLVYDEENNSIQPQLIKFQIQLGEYVNDIPTETLEKFLELGKVRPVKDKVVTRYMFGEFDSHGEAKEALNKLQTQGIREAELKGTFNGEIITLEEALNILGGKDQSFAD